MIIGITGPLGAGKGTIAEYLNKKHNVIYLSVRSFFAEEVLKRGQIATRDNITTVARDLRTEKGPPYALEQLLARAGTGGSGIFEVERCKFVVCAGRCGGSLQALYRKSNASRCYDPRAVY